MKIYDLRNCKQLEDANVELVNVSIICIGYDESVFSLLSTREMPLLKTKEKDWRQWLKKNDICEDFTIAASFNCLLFNGLMFYDDKPNEFLFERLLYALLCIVDDKTVVTTFYKGDSDGGLK